MLREVVWVSTIIITINIACSSGCTADGSPHDEAKASHRSIQTVSFQGQEMSRSALNMKMDNVCPPVLPCSKEGLLFSCHANVGCWSSFPFCFKDYFLFSSHTNAGYWSSFSFSVVSLQLGTVGTEIKVSSVENPELTNVLPLKPGLGQKIATHASPTTRNFFLNFCLLVCSASFFRDPLPTF